LLPVLFTHPAADSDLDGSDDDGDGLPPAPRWFQHYANLTKDKDREAKWMEASLRWFDSLFAQIYAVSARGGMQTPAVVVAAMELRGSTVDAVAPLPSIVTALRPSHDRCRRRARAARTRTR